MKLYFDTGRQQVQRVEWSNHADLLPNLMDGNIQTYWESDWGLVDQVAVDLYLPAKMGIEYVAWYQGTKFVDGVRVEILTQEGWKLFAEEVQQSDLKNGWNILHGSMA